jgi:predicted RNase H-like HicB family nuclease/uncharacterized damage-inducible protein DinB
MTEYALYLESGPKHKTTMAHVTDLLGCVARGPTTEAALEATPAAIRLYLGFLARHDDQVNPEAPFTVRAAQHVTEGPWIGYGDPAPGFTPDFEPLEADQLGVHLCRLSWLHDDLLGLVKALTREEWLTQPEKGRTIRQILEHLAESDGYYLRYLVGKVEGLPEALKAVREGPPEALPAMLFDLWGVTAARLRILTEAERTAKVPHGQVTWTARRALRRMLEHAWEHLLEIAERLDQDRER